MRRSVLVVLALVLSACGGAPPAVEAPARLAGDPSPHWREVALANQACYAQHGDIEVRALHYLRPFFGEDVGAPGRLQTDERYPLQLSYERAFGFVEGTAHPAFHPEDVFTVVETRGDTTVVFVEPVSESLRHYFSELFVLFGPEEQILGVTGRVNIYGGVRGVAWKEDYVAEYREQGGCAFPRSVRYYAPRDTAHARPRIWLKLSYDL